MAGYAGEEVVLPAPADQPIANNQSLASVELLKKQGLLVELHSTD